MRRRLAALALTASFALPAQANHAVQQAVRKDLDGWAVAAFTLSDQERREFTRDRLHGRWTFVLFGDATRCGQPCGDALAAVAGLCLRIAPADAMKTTQVLFISLDPRRDTPARLRQYLAAYDSRFIGATGTPVVLQQLADDLGIGAARGSLLLVGPDATIRAEYLPPFDVPRLTAAYLRARRGSR